MLAVECECAGRHWGCNTADVDPGGVNGVGSRKSGLWDVGCDEPVRRRSEERLRHAGHSARGKH
eukprot:1967196-Rhodomonas_salina.1